MSNEKTIANLRTEGLANFECLKVEIHSQGCNFGCNFREAFIAPKGKKLIGIDYSQIELRLLAHFSQDSVLVDAFRHDKDIHLQTAIVLFGEEEAAAKRSVAKTV